MTPVLSLVLLLAQAAGDLPAFFDDPPRLVAVRPRASFYITVKDARDATWLLTVALAFRAQ
jgi:hypothetical protein